MDRSVIQDLEVCSRLPDTLLPRLWGCVGEVFLSQPPLEQIKEIAFELGVKNDQIQRLISAMAAFLWECIKSNLSVIDGQRFAEQAFNSAISPITTFVEFYSENRERLLLSKRLVPLSGTQYQDMQWRVDLEIAHRALLSPSSFEPSVIIRIDTSESAEPLPGHIIFQSDYANTQRLHLKLKEAQAELKSVHAQRMIRYIK